MKNKAMAIIIIFLSLFSIFLGVLISFSQKQLTTTTLRAEGSDCDLCINEPPCCAEIRNTHDAFGCDWPTRGWCQPSTCSQIEGKGQRCGWYWIFHNANDNDYKLGTNSPNGYGCMIGETEQTMRPRCGPQASIIPTKILPSTSLQPTTFQQPTNPPQPTTAPLQPTVVIPRSPTQPLPSSGGTFNIQTHTATIPTKSPQAITIPQITFPQFTFPSIQIHFNPTQINQEAAKPLGFFESLFEAIIHYDQLLEISINNTFHTIFK